MMLVLVLGVIGAAIFLVAKLIVGDEPPAE